MIDTQAIRSKILDLAIRGQLTEQLSEDGTAEELYQQIQAEKQAQIKAGKIKKEKPLPEITENEIPFEIPSNWKWVRLGSLLHVINGVSYNKSDVSSKGIRILRGGNIQNLKILLDSSDVFLPAEYKEDEKTVKKGDVVIVASTGSETVIGKAGFIDKDDNNTMIGAFLRICRPISSEFSSFNRIIFMSDYYLQHIRNESKGTNINNIKEKYLTHFVVPLPPLAEQKRIVKKIEQAFSVLDTIDALQAQYADNLTVLKAKLIDAAIQGKLTDQLPEDGTAEELYQQIQAEKQAQIKAGKIKKEKPLPEITENEIPFEIPSNWKWVRLGSIARILGGKRIPAGRSLTEEDTGHKYIRVSDMNNHTVKTKGLLFVPEDIYPSISQYIINKEDIYITVAGTIGRVGKIPPEIDGANLTENADRIVFSHLNQDWFIICLSSSAIQKQIERLTTSVAQPKLAIKRIQDFLIPLSPLAEQQRIVKQINELIYLCDNLK